MIYYPNYLGTQEQTSSAFNNSKTEKFIKKEKKVNKKFNEKYNQKCHALNPSNNRSDI